MKRILTILAIGTLIIVALILWHPTKPQTPATISSTSPAASPSSLPSPTPFPLSIPSLQTRQYNASNIHQESTVSSNGNFTSSIVSFMVDGLKEYALLNIPKSPRPKDGYPVVIIAHGYIDPKQYNTVTSYRATGDYFASQGYLVLKPDYRGNANSQVDNTALMRFAYPVDVMTLLSSVKNIPEANPKKIYIWGHSMGGEVTLEVLEVLGKRPDIAHNVKAAVLWAPVTDPVKWFEKSHRPSLVEAQTTPSPYADTIALLGEPSSDSPVWKSLSPLTYLQDITVPLQLNHGTSDPTVPYAWSNELTTMLKQTGKSIDFISYPNADHNLAPLSAKGYQNSLLFFGQHQ